MPEYREMPKVSKSEINRCGDYLARLHRLRALDDSTGYDEAYDADQMAYATQLVDDFRAAHQKPLSITSVGLRQFVNTTLGTTPVVSQRLKRLPRIVRKLANMGSSNLARLEDIGGTRAVVPGLREQEALCAHIERRWGHSIRRTRDYVDDPKATGYRARHYVIEKEGRRVEIQVRTRRQQVWANRIEQTDSRLGTSLKDGKGAQSLLEYFTAMGAMLYFQETNTTPTPELAQQLQAAENAVVSEGFFVRRGES
ncbi:RelA/SpoT domain-containing protein [Microbacterium sp. KSW2-21]|uniref:RelA/SpoT domain-containing protein n=1 Tax=Microbacterium algihabitans TaxID=3075992 RepID=A0ABU3RWI5_9MICO|nr:RelA/SpoT domain-containing protein [Microbacterium sp. KSW2-21]MDU0327222.1 RelA/SpoT domain-containing protein [Microbacterium sp. KSW2-21]